MEKYDIVIQGVAPYIHNRFPDEDENVSIRRGGNTTEERRKNEADATLNKTEDNKIGVPSVQIEGMLNKSSAELKWPGHGRKSLQAPIKAGIIVEPIGVIPMMPQDWEILISPVVIQRARIRKARALVKNWSLEFVVSNSNDAVLSSSAVRQALELGGSNYGIGDWRPKYGRFKVTKFEMMKNGRADNS